MDNQSKTFAQLLYHSIYLQEIFLTSDNIFKKVINAATAMCFRLNNRKIFLVASIFCLQVNRVRLWVWPAQGDVQIQQFGYDVEDSLFKYVAPNTYTESICQRSFFRYPSFSLSNLNWISEF